MAYSLLSRFEKKLENVLNTSFEPLVILSEQIRKISLNSSNRNSNIDNLPLSFYWLQIDMYLKYANGGIGYDMFIAHRFLWQMQGYLWILSNEDLEDKDKDACKNELRINFYVLLNCIYNIKEKWLKFLNFDKKQTITIMASILNKIGQKALNEKLKLLYKDIKIICSARDCLVHDISKISYDNVHKTLQITQSKFTLSEDKVWKKAGLKTCYKFTGNDILNLFITLENHRKNILLDLSNTLNIDCLKLKEKYLSDKNKSYAFGLL
jgi:hypothetical protein